MKIVRRKAEAPDLWKFAIEELPDSLTARVESLGYGAEYRVYVKETAFFSCLKPLIATIIEDKVLLYHPQYFSDFEDLIRKYENKYKKKNIVLEYFEED